MALDDYYASEEFNNPTRDENNTYETDSSELEMIEKKRIRNSILRRENYQRKIEKDLYERENKKGIKNKENDTTELIQKLLKSYNALSQGINQEKEDTPKMNAILEPKTLVLDLIKNFYKEGATVELELLPTIMDHLKKIKVPEGRRTGIKIEKEENEPCLDGSKSLKVDDGKTGKTEGGERSKIVRKVRVIMGANKPIRSYSKCEKGRVSDDDNGKVDRCKIYHGSSQGTGRDNNGALENADCDDDDKTIVEEDEDIKEPIGKNLDHACQSWLEKVTKFKKLVGWDKSNRLKEESQYLNDRGAGIDDDVARQEWNNRGADRDNKEAAKGLVGINSNRIEIKHTRRRNLTWKDKNDGEHNKEKSIGIEIDKYEHETNLDSFRSSEINSSKESCDLGLRHETGVEDSEKNGIKFGVNEQQYKSWDINCVNGYSKVEAVDDGREEGEKEPHVKNKLEGNMIVQSNPGGRYDDINCSRNSISPFENQKAKLEWNLEPTEGGCPGTKGLEGLENSRPDRMDVCSIDLKLAVDKFESKNIWSEDQFQGSNVQVIGNDSSKGIILVSKIKGEEDQRRRIVSNDGRYQTNDKKIEDLPISDQEVIQNIEYAEKGVIVASEVGDINKHMNVIIENEMNNLLFDPRGNILPKNERK
ncbi:30530_t:CDS:2 [Gigaspora margarita]|uniref:30530_t:CDS:1 n=1 Tax=Gigaspora margarita TaxID=4874 RepID=A0ABN7UEP9_GIGMA|nr:30530_t:CDS:2 [Gigaspora margarita]